MTIEFLITALIVVLLPGTGVLYTLATGLAFGARASALAALGCTLGIVPQLFLATFGLSVLLHSSEEAFQVLKIGGAIYLLYMAWQVVGGEGALKLEADHASCSDNKIIGTGIWLNLLNPKLGLFFIAFLPQFVPADIGNPKLSFLLLGFVFVAMTLATFVCYGMLAARVRDHVITRPRVMIGIRWSFALAFLCLGLRLGLDAV